MYMFAYTKRLMVFVVKVWGHRATYHDRLGHVYKGLVIVIVINVINGVQMLWELKRSTLLDLQPPPLSGGKRSRCASDLTTVNVL